MWSLRRKVLSNIFQVRHFYTSKVVRKDYYDVLGVERNSTVMEIKDAYYALSKVHHPDITGSIDERDIQRFRDITEAYEVLSNTATRKLYDRGLQIKAKAPEGKYDPSFGRFYESRDESKTSKYRDDGKMADLDVKMQQKYAQQLYESVKAQKEQYDPLRDLFTQGQVRSAWTLLAIIYLTRVVLNIIAYFCDEPDEIVY